MGSGKSSAQMPAPTVQKSNNADLEAMAMMANMMATLNQQINMPKPPAPMPMPQIKQTPNVNWQQINNQLLTRSRAAYNAQQTKKKSMASTIHTSPLLEEESLTTSTSILK